LVAVEVAQVTKLVLAVVLVVQVDLTISRVLILAELAPRGKVSQVELVTAQAAQDLARVVAVVLGQSVQITALHSMVVMVVLVLTHL
jgi:hypothetical protein